MKVYVILANRGEYSDRETWVSGVYLTKQEAQDNIDVHHSKYRLHANWQMNYWREARRLRDLPEYSTGEPRSFNRFKPGSIYEYRRLTDFGERYLTEITGTEPEREDGEYWEIQEATVGEWKGKPND